MPPAWVGPLVERFRAWAAEEPAVRAALIVGSQARTVVPADEWSDLDIVIFHTAPERLIGSTDWIRQFGSVVLTIVEPTAVLGGRERRVLYAEGRDVDFAVFPAEATRQIGESPEGLAVLGRGYRVLVDKDHRFPGDPHPVPPVAVAPLLRPSEAKFQASVADFWYHVPWAAKKLRRGELWTAKQGIDGYLKRLLVEMIGWHAAAQKGEDVDTWHAGRFLERWAEPPALARFPSTFCRYELHDLQRGLDETGRLYSDLAQEVAKANRWHYPLEVESAVLTLTRSILEATPATP